MADPGLLASGKPVPPVNADDLKRVWHAIGKISGIARSTAGLKPTASFGIDHSLMAPHCGPGADVAAVSLRAILLHAFFQAGSLNDWREGSEPADRVFQVGAVFPIEQGVERFDTVAFFDRLRDPEL